MGTQTSPVSAPFHPPQYEGWAGALVSPKLAGWLHRKPLRSTLPNVNMAVQREDDIKIIARPLM